MVGQHDERWQVAVGRSQGVVHPAAGAGKAGQHETGGLVERGGRMDSGGADHVVDEGHPVDDLAKRCDDVGEQLAAFTVGLEGPDRREPRPEAILKGLDGLAKIARLARVFDQFGLVVEEVDVAGRAGHEQLHHPLRFHRIDAGWMCRGGL